MINSKIFFLLLIFFIISFIGCKNTIKRDNLVITKLTSEQVRDIPITEDNSVEESSSGENNSGEGNERNSDRATGDDSATFGREEEISIPGDERYFSSVNDIPVCQSQTFISLFNVAGNSLNGKIISSTVPSMVTDKLDFSVEEVRGVDHFRDSIKKKNLPLPDDLTYLDLFYDYFFDKELDISNEEVISETPESFRPDDSRSSGAKGFVCDKLLCPSYVLAVSQDPFSKQPEYFISPDLMSDIKQKEPVDSSDYKRIPLVFDLRLTLEAPGFELQTVYGSPEADPSSGKLVAINRFLPPEITEKRACRGLVLLHLKKLSDNNQEIRLTLDYEDRDGKKDSNFTVFKFKKTEQDYYATKGIRKGIALARYANLMQNWIWHERLNMSFSRENGISREIGSTMEEEEAPSSEFLYRVYYDQGIPVPSAKEFQPGKWSQQSLPLSVSPEYKKLFGEFIPYFREEQKKLGDETMKKELEILNILFNYQDGNKNDGT